ncbi:hypothetical protein AIOL_001674 [Candidatus Rhodobacter oscarellae]|uniref:Outer membrane protein beta-barrel domain-containing protein n=1 Tax=Candidatus Rhodobacter oscarellae TaxID=1675527 RepID=A0A0J9E4E7_9RHOB|nr:hypothetical protein [Candidatus Rhodobacter lobularis]KMW56719.1 hypothetical protein AIOL_001674 [Candidatus Rhodobacter lobularis]
MRNLTKSIVIAGLTLAPFSVQAEGLYGYTSLGMTANDVTDDGAAEGTSNGLKGTGVVGYSFTNGMFFEGEGLVQFASAGPNTPQNNDSLSSGNVLGFRAGQTFGNASAELAFGIAQGVTDEGSTDRHYIALGGGYAFNEQFSATGLLGYLDGTGGTDRDGLDGMRQLTHVALGLEYLATDQLGVNFGAAYGEGIMDNGIPEDMDVTQVWLGADYAVNDAIDLYGKVSWLEINQAREDDVTQETRVEIGLQWTFGATESRPSRTRPDLPDYSDWLALSAGVTE